MSAPSHRRLALTLGALAALGPFSIDMYLPALPAIAAELEAAPGAVQGTLAVYFFGLACGQLLYGPLSDRWGRRRPLFAGLALYAAAAAACAAAPAITTLLLARGIQAFGGCAGMVIARAVVRDVAEGAAAVRLFASLLLVMGIAPVIAPTLGGLMLPLFGWRSIFVLLTLYSLAMIAVVALFLPETLPPQRRRHDGFAANLTIWRNLLSDSRFLGHALAGGCIIGGMFAYITASPFVLMELHGIGALHYGLAFGANALGIMLASQLTSRLAQVRPLPRLLAAALTVPPLAGSALLVLAMVGGGGLLPLLMILFCYVAMVGAVMPLATALAMAPYGAVAGSASALIGSLQFAIGASAGILLGLLEDGTALPMAAVMAGLGVCGWATHRLLAR